MRILGLGTALWILIAALVPAAARADESARQDSPAPTSVEGMTDSFKPQLWEDEPILFPWLHAKIQSWPAFFRDARLIWNTRTYYFNNRGNDDQREEAWTLGGSLRFQSGKILDVFSVGAALYTSQKLLGKKSEDGTLLLRERQKSITVLGQSWARLDYAGLSGIFYRQQLDLPYVNIRDSRMAPNTYEAYTLQGSYAEKAGLADISFVASHVTRMKERSSHRFKSMSEIAGVADGSHGMSIGGVRVGLTENLYAGSIGLYVKDTLFTSYSAVDYLWNVTPQLGTRFQGQFTSQQSVGDDDLTGESFDTWVVGARASLSYKHFIASVGFSVTDDDQRIRSPWGSYPGYLGLMQANFNRAREKAWLVGLSYDFSRQGLPGFSLFFNYAEGHDAIDSDTRLSEPDRREFDLTIDYKVKRDGWLNGLWFRVRGSILDIDGEGKNANELRVIVNWPLPAL